MPLITCSLWRVRNWISEGGEKERTSVRKPSALAPIRRGGAVQGGMGAAPSPGPCPCSWHHAEHCHSGSPTLGVALAGAPGFGLERRGPLVHLVMYSSCRRQVSTVPWRVLAVCCGSARPTHSFSVNGTNLSCLSRLSLIGSKTLTLDYVK